MVQWALAVQQSFFKDDFEGLYFSVNFYQQGTNLEKSYHSTPALTSNNSEYRA